MFEIELYTVLSCRFFRLQWSCATCCWWFLSSASERNGMNRMTLMWLTVKIHHMMMTTALDGDCCLFIMRFKPNTHRRRRRDETVLSRRVGVGGVYMNSRRLPTDSNAQHSRRRPVYNSAANGSRLPAGVFAPMTRRNRRQLVANSCTHRRRDATRQFRLVGVDGVYWALNHCRAIGIWRF